MSKEIKIYKSKPFIKKYLVAIIMGSLAIVMGLAITIISTMQQPVVPVNVLPITFQIPVANAEIIKDYSDTDLQYNKTLNQWEAHKAIDFAASANTNVTAVYNGSVIETGSTYLWGYYVIIEHGNGIKTIYKSLGKELKVKKGDTVKTGTVIGVISTTAAAESSEGPHLHFEVTKNDVRVNPNTYFSSDK